MCSLLSFKRAPACWIKHSQYCGSEHDPKNRHASRRPKQNPTSHPLTSIPNGGLEGGFVPTNLSVSATKVEEKRKQTCPQHLVYT